MTTKNDIYRNPPAPIGYVCKKKPELVCKENIDIHGINCKFMDFIIDSGILDVSDCTIYDDFIINASSEEEEIVEIPVKLQPKVIEVIDVDAEVAATPYIKEESLVAVKKEANSEEPHASTETSHDVEEVTQISAPSRHEKITVKKELSCHKGEKVTSQKKVKKHDHDSKRGPRSKKIQERKDTYNEYGSDNEFHSKKSKHKIRIDNKSDGESNSRSKHKKKVHESESRRDDHKKRDGYKSDGYKSDKISCSNRGDYRRDFENDNSSYSYEIKPKREPGYYSDDNDSSIRKVTGRIYSPTPGCSKDIYTDEYDRTVANIKQETQSGQIYGMYPCKVCNITLNSHSTYQSHVAGKKHQKALNAQNAAGVVSQSSATTEAASKYPKPPPGFHRKELNTPAYIQNALDQDSQTPRPAQDEVIEIRGVAETSYFCSLCNAHCSVNCIMAHLNGFKHQLHSLEKYYPRKYEAWRYSPKYQIERDVRNELIAIERKYGRGRVKVEKDTTEIEKGNPDFDMALWRDADMPSTSQAGPGSNFSDCYLTSSIPDPTKSGYYCRLCDSHSNSQQMWTNHIVGKRHLGNLKKGPGAAPSKSKYIPAPNARPHLEMLLAKVDEPVVGLNQIREIRKPEIDGVTYNCYLCSACITSVEIVEHILSRKHREKYLDHINHPELETLRNCQMSEAAADCIIGEICGRVEADRGRGITEVFYTKNSIRM